MAVETIPAPVVVGSGAASGAAAIGNRRLTDRAGPIPGPGQTAGRGQEQPFLATAAATEPASAAAGSGGAMVPARRASEPRSRRGIGAAGAFIVWLQHAAPDDAVVYFHGCLARAREVDRDVDSLAAAMWEAQHAERVALCQRRAGERGDGEFAYIARRLADRPHYAWPVRHSPPHPQRRDGRHDGAPPWPPQRRYAP